MGPRGPCGVTVRVKLDAATVAAVLRVAGFACANHGGKHEGATGNVGAAAHARHLHGDVASAGDSDPGRGIMNSLRSFQVTSKGRCSLARLSGRRASFCDYSESSESTLALLHC